jgi:transcriptional regulator with XRE-family HTH domain
MGREKWANERFGERVKALRDDQGWSQAEMAKMLSDKGVPMHPTTVAKIEAGDRSVRINEAEGIADLFEVSLDSLVGRKQRPDRDLNYALGALMDAAHTLRTELDRSARSLGDRLEDIPADFAGYDMLVGHGREVFAHLDTTREALGQLQDHLKAHWRPDTEAMVAWIRHIGVRIEKNYQERKRTANEPQE